MREALVLVLVVAACGSERRPARAPSVHAVGLARTMGALEAAPSTYVIDFGSVFAGGDAPAATCFSPRAGEHVVLLDPLEPWEERTAVALHFDASLELPLCCVGVANLSDFPGWRWFESVSGEVTVDAASWARGVLRCRFDVEGAGGGRGARGAHGFVELALDDPLLAPADWSWPPIPPACAAVAEVATDGGGRTPPWPAPGRVASW